MFTAANTWWILKIFRLDTVHVSK